MRRQSRRCGGEQVEGTEHGGCQLTAAQMKALLDSTGGQRQEPMLAGKLAGFFFATGI